MKSKQNTTIQYNTSTRSRMVETFPFTLANLLWCALLPVKFQISEINISCQIHLLRWVVIFTFGTLMRFSVANWPTALRLCYAKQLHKMELVSEH